MLEIRKAIIEEIFDNCQYWETRKEIRAFCPRHRHHTRKLWISLEKNIFRCWFCPFSGRIFKLLREYATKEQAKKYLSTIDDGFVSTIADTNFSLSFPEDYKFLLSNLDTPLGRKSAEILRQFQISDEVILQAKIGFCDKGEYSNRLLFPSFDDYGRLNYFITRTLYDSYKKYLDCNGHKSAIVFNENFINWSLPVVLVENVKAHLRHFNLGNVIPVLGSDLSENYKLFQEIILNDCPMVYIAFDPEARSKAVELCSKFLSHGQPAKVVSFLAQPDEISTNEFAEAIKTSSEISKTDLLVSALMEI